MKSTVMQPTYVDIRETAAMLSVSQATVRNWVKAGKLQPVEKENRRLLFERKAIEKLVEEIASGKSHRLKSRRNKKAVKGHVIPAEYVSSKVYLEAAETILHWVSHTNEKIDLRLILYEIALNLLVERRLLHVPETDVSLTEGLQNGLWALGSYQTVFHELFNPAQPLNEKDKTILRKIRNMHLPFIEGDDLLGLLYMSLSSLGTRKNKGSYYTPSDIVDQLINQSLRYMDRSLTPRVVDPCCGSGNFMIRLFIELKRRLLENGWSVEAAEKALLSESLYAWDIDPTAVILTKINLLLLLETPYDDQEHCLLHIREQDTLATYGTLFGAENDDTFDLVIGNPPWGYSFSDEEAELLRQKFVTANGPLESFDLFIEYGIDVLKPGGILSYVLPESLLNVQIHETTRRFLIEQAELCQINLLGHRFSKVFAPSILVTARKTTKAADNHEIMVVHEDKHYTVSQSRFSKNERTILNVRASDDEEDVLDHMRTLSGVEFLKNQADFALGIVTGNNKQFILDEPVDGAEPVIRGGDVFKFNFYSSEQYMIFQPERFQQVAPEKWYRAKEKLIYRFINEQLVFSYDNHGTLSLNSANVVIPRIPNRSVKYILAVLNSRAAQFFHELSFASVKVLRQHIEAIPIPPASSTDEHLIVELVEKLMDTEDKNERSRIYEEIDDHIMRLYQFTPSEIDVIKQRVRTKFLSR